MNLKNDYLTLLIKQYYGKPRARAEISALFKLFEGMFGVTEQFREAFSLEKATGDQLDIIGAWVGISRFQSSGERKGFFGFLNHDKALPFGQRFGNRLGGFRSRFAQDYLPLLLPDARYRHLIKLKIIRNTTQATATQSGDISTATLQSAVNFAMSGEAYLIDRQNMTMTIIITPRADRELLDFILRLDLLPRPQGVRLDYVILDPLGTFGFRGHTGSVSWCDRFSDNPNSKKGSFARKTFIQED